MTDLEVLLSYELDQIEERIEREIINKELCPKQSVVDGLLDLRNLATDMSFVIECIDDALANIPGLSLVKREWWEEQLGTIREACDSYHNSPASADTDPPAALAEAK